MSDENNGTCLMKTMEYMSDENNGTYVWWKQWNMSNENNGTCLMKTMEHVWWKRKPRKSLTADVKYNNN